MTLNRQTDGERLAMAELEIKYLQKGDQELKDRIDAVEAKVDIVDEKLDMVIARLDANSNQIGGAGKLAAILLKAFPWICGMLATFFAGRYV